MSFCVISYWRGIWILWDNLIFKDNLVLSGIISSSTSGLIIIVADIMTRTIYNKPIIQYTVAYPIVSNNIWANDIEVKNNEN